jgi:predicted dinucleotide-binding enzyme
MSQEKLKVAIIGLGNIGRVAATNLVKGGRAVIVADRTLEKAEGLAKELGALAQPRKIPAAIKEADIVVLAIWFDAIKELLQTYKSDLRGKIIVDPSNPFVPDEKGSFKKIIGERESGGEQISALLPDGASLAKALGTLSAGSLAKAAFRDPTRAVLFYASDDHRSNAAIEELIRDSGFEPVRVGGIDQSIRIELFGDLHEYGGLGKPVGVADLKGKV